MEGPPSVNGNNDWLQQLSALLDPVDLGAQTQLQSSWSGTSLMSTPNKAMAMMTTMTPLASSSTQLPASSPVRMHRRRGPAQKLTSVSKRRQTRATTQMKNVKSRSRSQCKSATDQTPSIPTTSANSATTITQAPHQASAASSTTTSQAPHSAAATLTSPRIPISIDSLAYVAAVFDSIFAPLIDGSSPLHLSIRQVLIKKLLLDHASQEILTRTIITFDDLQTFILDVHRHTTLIV